MDIYNVQSNRFMTYEEVVGTHGPIVTFLEYTAIKSAMPRLWKHEIKELCQDEAQTEVQKLSLNINPSKTLYWEYIDKYHQDNDACRELWQNELKVMIEEEEWKGLFPKIMKITFSAKFAIQGTND